MHAAIYWDSAPLVKALMKAGANPNAKLKRKFCPEDEFKPKGLTPIDMAEEDGADNLLRLLQGAVADNDLAGAWVLSTVRYESSPDDDPNHVPQDRPANPDELVLTLDHGGACTWKRFGNEEKGQWTEDSGAVYLQLGAEPRSLTHDRRKLLYTDHDEEHGSEYVMTLRKS